jgi:DNA primase
MFYSEELIEEIRGKNDIVDVISGYVKLTKKGANYWGLCPFHNEKSPSFAVSVDRQTFHCYGCGVGGNVYTFLMKYENNTFPEAVEELAERSGVALPQEKERTDASLKEESKRARILAANKEAATYFYYGLRAPKGEIGRQYFAKRGLSEEMTKKFGLGYADKSGQYLLNHLKQKGFEDKLLIEAGLARFTEKTGLMGQFWNRVMFPIQDLKNRVIGFGGRVMGEGEPKYLNSPETPVFDKRRNLYGLNFARTARGDTLILCEGYMDVIALHQGGFPRAVASLGTAFTAEQAGLLRRYTDTVLLAYDSDGAGVKAALRGIGILREAGISARVINMRPYKDPDEFIKALGHDAFLERMNQAVNSFFYEIQVLEGDFDLTDPEQRTRFYREIGKKLCVFTEEIERENYLRAIADRYQIEPANLRRLMSTFAADSGSVKPRTRPKSGLAGKQSPKDSIHKTQSLLLNLLAEEPDIYPKLARFLSVEDFEGELYQKLADKLFRSLKEGSAGFRLGDLISIFPEEEQQREAAEVIDLKLPHLQTKEERAKALKDVLLKLKQNSIRQAILHANSAENMQELIKKRKVILEELAKTNISLD